MARIEVSGHGSNGVSIRYNAMVNAHSDFLSESDARELMRQLAEVLCEKEDERGNEVEHLRLQLAGCSVAAQGWIDEQTLARRGDYGWSASYQDVVNLRREYDDLVRWLRMRNELKSYRA